MGRLPGRYITYVIYEFFDSHYSVSLFSVNDESWLILIPPNEVCE